MKHYSTYQSQFIEMFGNLDTNIKSYPVTTVEKISLSLFAGGDKPEDTSTERTDKYIYPVWANGEGERGLMGYSKTYRVDKEALTISARGTIGYCAIREPYFTPIVRLITLIPNEKVDIVYLKYFFDQTGFESTGAVQGQLTIPTIKVKKVLVPPIEEQMKFAEVVKQADKSKFTSLKSQFIEMFKDLPNNGKIEDLVDKSIASVKKSYQREDEIEYIDISSIDNATNTVMETTRYKVSGAPSRAQQCVRNGDILVSTVRPINRNIAVITKDLDNLVASTGFCVLRPKEGYREYLLSIVKSDVYTERMCDKASGGLYPAVNNSDVFSYEIHIPEERVAEKVSSIYKQADKSKYIN